MCIPSACNPHGEFVKLCPLIERRARMVFRNHPRADREEAIAEAIAAAFESYTRLKARGQDPVHDFPSTMVTFAVLHVQNDRHVGGSQSTTDVLSRKAQRRHGFRVESLPASTHTSLDSLYGQVDGQRDLDAFEERLQDNRQTPVPEQAAFRIDFPEFLASLSPRDSRLADLLSLGHTARKAARVFHLSPARLSQLRQQWRKEWRSSQGDGMPEPEEAVAYG